MRREGPVLGPGPCFYGGLETLNRVRWGPSAGSNIVTVLGYISTASTFLPVTAVVRPYLRPLGVALIIVGIFRGAQSVIKSKNAELEGIRAQKDTEIAALNQRIAELTPDSNEPHRQEVLQLLRHGKWTAPKNRPVTGGGFPLVYEYELMDNSVSLKRLGEIGLHDILVELRQQGIIDNAEPEGDRWFARY
jgi:hypothetical protein